MLTREFQKRIGRPLGKLVSLSKGLWLEVRRWRCECGGKPANREGMEEGRKLPIPSLFTVETSIDIESTRWR